MSTVLIQADEYDELVFLRYFYQEADFGPAHGDVMAGIKGNYGSDLPAGYELDE